MNVKIFVRCKVRLIGQSQIIEDKIYKIKSQGHGCITKVLKMRKFVAGFKKQKQEALAVIDSSTGKMVVSCEEIKRVNLEHCVRVLKNKIPKPEIQQLLKFQSELHDIIMKEDADKETSITQEEYDEVLLKFKKKNNKSFFSF